jgi:hypothetical protein
VKLALQAIADAQGDVDGYIGQYDEETRKVPRIATKIARRLLAVGRVEEAWSVIEATAPKPRAREDWLDLEWEDARIEVLEAAERGEDAQTARWGCFERALTAAHLRAYLKRLPDFDDVEAEEKALDYASGAKSFFQALEFLVSWPDLNRAAELVIKRAGELDGDRYEILTPAAAVLAAKHPLAAVLVLRAMINFSFTKNRSSRYKHAAQHLRECGSLSETITNFGAFERHDAYVARLRLEHDRKSSFWRLLG